MKFLTLFFFLFTSFLTWADYQYEVQLKDLGFQSGLKSTRELTTRSLYLNLPEKDLIKSIELHLNHTMAPNLSDSSYIRAMANNKVIGYVQKNTQGRSILKFNARNIVRDGGVNFQFDLYAALAEDVECAPNIFFNNLIQISSDSKFVVTLSEKPKKINDYLLSLPREFSVKVPDRNLLPTEFVFLSRLKQYVSTFGKKMSVSRTTNYSDIILGSTDELRSFNERVFGRVVNFDYKPQVRVFGTREQQVLGIRVDDNDFPYTGMFSFVGGMNTGKLVNYNSSKSLEIKNVMKFERTSDSEFELNYNNKNINGLETVKKINLSLSLANKFDKEELILNIYKNDHLIKILELAQSEDPQFFSIDVPAASDRLNETIRIKAFSKGKGETCSRKSRFELNILPDTNFIMERIAAASDFNFVHFLKQNNRKTSFYFPQSALVDIDPWLDYFSLFLASSGLNFSLENLNFYEALPANIISGAVIFSDTIGIGVNGPHSLNPVEMKSNFMELGTLNGSKVLHFHVATKKMPVNLSYLEFGLRDLSYFDSGRVLYTLNSKREKKFQVSYSDKNSWQVIFRKYKIYIFIFFWLLVTFFFIRFAKKKKL